MSSWLCNCFRKKSPPPVDYWDCSRLKLFVLPEEVTRHRKTLTSLDMSVNNFRDVPKVREKGRETAKDVQDCIQVSPAFIVITDRACLTVRVCVEETKYITLSMKSNLQSLLKKAKLSNRNSFNFWSPVLAVHVLHA